MVKAVQNPEMKNPASILLIVLINCAGLMAQVGDLQKRVKLDLRGTTLKDCLQKLSNDFGLNFYYSGSRLPLDKHLDMNFGQISLAAALDSIFQDTGIQYEIRRGSILLLPVREETTIIGTVLDAVTGNPVSYAHIAFPDKATGTTSNELGAFELKSDYRPDVILVSHLEYTATEVDAGKPDNLIIRLQPAERLLPGITVRARKDPMAYYRLIGRAVRHLESVRDQMSYAKAFYRQKSSRSDRYSELYEIFFDVEYTPSGISGWQVLEGRYAFQKDEDDSVFLYNRNFSLVSRIFPLLQPSTEEVILPLNANAPNLFDLKLDEVVRQGKRNLAVIGFSPKEGFKQRAASGQLWIDMESAEVLKMSLHFSNPAFNIIRLSDASGTWKNYVLDVEMTFRESEKGQSLLLDYIHVEHSFDYYLNDTYRGPVQTTSVLAFYEHYELPIPRKNRRLSHESSDTRAIHEVGYEPLFWRDNPIVQRTPLEEKIARDFENNQAFGIIFSNNRDELVFAADIRNDPAAAYIMESHSLVPGWQAGRRVFLHLDRQILANNQEFRFRAFVYNRWTGKPDPFSDVLRVYLLDMSGAVIQQWSYTLQSGTTTGRLVPEPELKPGCYQLLAKADNVPQAVFKTGLIVPGDVNEATADSTGHDVNAPPPDVKFSSGKGSDAPAMRAVLGNENLIEVYIRNPQNQANPVFLAYRKEGIILYLTRAECCTGDGRIDLPAFLLKPGLSELLLLDQTGEIIDIEPVYLSPAAIYPIAVSLRKSNRLGSNVRTSIRIELPISARLPDSDYYSVRITGAGTDFSVYPPSRFTAAVPGLVPEHCRDQPAALRYMLDTDTLGLMHLKLHEQIPSNPFPDGNLTAQTGIQCGNKLLYWSDQLRPDRNGVFEFRLQIPKECGRIILHLEGCARDGRPVSLVKELDIHNRL